MCLDLLRDCTQHRKRLFGLIHAEFNRSSDLLSYEFAARMHSLATHGAQFATIVQKRDLKLQIVDLFGTDDQLLGFV
jgi:hypothetical protein